jgi:hypothetical protein
MLVVPVEPVERLLVVLVVLVAVLCWCCSGVARAGADTASEYPPVPCPRVPLGRLTRGATADLTGSVSGPDIVSRW